MKKNHIEIKIIIASSSLLFFSCDPNRSETNNNYTIEENKMQNTIDSLQQSNQELKNQLSAQTNLPIEQNSENTIEKNNIWLELPYSLKLNKTTYNDLQNQGFIPDKTYNAGGISQEFLLYKLNGNYAYINTGTGNMTFLKLWKSPQKWEDELGIKMGMPLKDLIYILKESQIDFITKTNNYSTYIQFQNDALIYKFEFPLKDNDSNLNDDIIADERSGKLFCISIEIAA